MGIRCKTTFFFKDFLLFFFLSLPGHFVWSLTFPTPYIFCSVHDSSTFCQNIMGCLQSWSEMPSSVASLTLCINNTLSIVAYTFKDMHEWCWVRGACFLLLFIPYIGIFWRFSVKMWMINFGVFQKMIVFILYFGAFQKVRKKINALDFFFFFFFFFLILDQKLGNSNTDITPEVCLTK